MTALYLTIWISMVLFAAGESGRSFTPRGQRPPPWAWWTFAAGLVLAIVHTLLAFALVHQWSQENAINATAAQTQAIYGVAVGNGVYVNYAFLGVWLADAWWWRRSPDHARPAFATLAIRAFYLVIIFNATVVFATGARRIAGILLVSWLARAWTGNFIAPGPPAPRQRSAADRTVSR